MIYFIQADGIGHIKIGFTDKEDALYRLAELQVGSPVPLRLLWTMPGTMDDEKDLHRRFASAKVAGEWFKPVPELLALAGLGLSRLGETEVVVKSVQIKALTVGRRSFTETMLRQLPEKSLVDWELFKKALLVPWAACNFIPEKFEVGDYWGWVSVRPKPTPKRTGWWPRPDSEPTCVVIFENHGILYRYPVGTKPDFHLPDRDHDQHSAVLCGFWDMCWSRWMLYKNQLFIGV